MNKEAQKGSIQDIVENPSEYSQEYVEFAKYMKSRFEEVGTVWYNSEGMGVVSNWVGDYLKEKYKDDL